MKSMLGTMMVRAGLLSEGQVASANDKAKRDGLRFVEAVLELELADEDAIVAFVQSKLMIPRVREAVLGRVQPEPLALVPARLAWEHDVLPVSLDQTGNLTLAMADPTDVKAVNAIAAHTHAYLVRAVAPLGALRDAMLQHYGSKDAAMAEPAPATPAPTPAAPPAPTPPPAAAPAPAPAPAATSPSPAPAVPAAPPGPGVVTPAPRVPAQTPPPPVVGTPAPQVSSTLPPPPVHNEANGAAPLATVGLPSDQQRPAPGRKIDPRAATMPPIVPEPAPVRHSNALPPTNAPAPQAAQVNAQLPTQQGAVPEAIARARSRTPAAGASRSWNPPLSGSSAEPIPLSPEAFEAVLPRVASATERDELTRVLLDFLGAGFQRVLLFVHSRNELRGHDSRGADLLPEAVKQVRLPATGPSVFSKVIERKQPYFGPMPRTEQLDVAFAQALGGVKGNVLVLPVLLSDKVPLLVFAQNTRHAVDPFSVRDLSDAVAQALTRILSKR